MPAPTACTPSRQLHGWLTTNQRPAGDPLDGAGCGALNGASSHSVQAFKASAIAAIREYFDSSDAAEVGRSLGDLEEPGLTNIFVKQVRSPLQRVVPSPWDETNAATGHG